MSSSVTLLRRSPVNTKHLFRTLLLVFISAMFLTDIIRMVSSFFDLPESYHQRSINAAFRSAFGIFELVMIGITVFFAKKYPARRVRLLSLLFFHVIGVLVLPMGTRNFALMAITVPWPQTLLAFDHSTPLYVTIASCAVGFLVIPGITLLWGRKAFCGYVCPIGGFYSENLGRLFSPKPGRLKWLSKSGPLVMFVVMSAALVSVLVFPASIDPIRRVQRVYFFAVSQVLYFTVGVSLIGARAYCTHACPLGFEVGLVVKVKRTFFGRKR